MTDVKTKGGVPTVDVDKHVDLSLVEGNKAAFQVNAAHDNGFEEELDTEPAPISIKEVLAELDGVFPMDEAVVEGKDGKQTKMSAKRLMILQTVLPEGSTFVTVERFGTSAWTVTGRLTTTDADGEEVLYFLKVHCHITVSSDSETTSLTSSGCLR